MISKQIFFSFLALAFARGEAETLKGAVKCGPPSLHTDWANVTSVAGGKAILTCPLDTVNSCLVDLVSSIELLIRFCWESKLLRIEF